MDVREFSRMVADVRQAEAALDPRDVCPNRSLWTGRDASGAGRYMRRLR